MAAIICCSPTPPKPPLPIFDDGGTPSDVCEASCRNQRRLVCVGATGQSTASGKTCETICRMLDAKYNLMSECISRSIDCDAVYKCLDAAP